MPKSRYKSPKPAHQDVFHKTQPPMGSVAVFEWETFSPLQDFTDKSLIEVFKRISSDIIERPYHYAAHKLVDEQGNVNYKPRFTPANNSMPPKKIPGTAVYKQNHGTGHAIRQMSYTDTLIDKIAADGNPTGRELAKKINNNPEIKSILKLAAYCKRIGRTLDFEEDKDKKPKNASTIYSQRSADMFSQIATELGYNDDLIKIIKDSMLEPSPADPVTLNGYRDIAEISGKDLRYFAQNIFMAAHMADLTRLLEVKRNYIESSLKYYFNPIKVKEVCTELVEIGCKANAMTGNPVVQQEDGVNHKLTSLDGKKLVKVVKNIGKTIDDLAQLKFATPSVGVIASEKPPISSQNKSVFAFDIDDTLIQKHSFRVHGGPLFDQEEMSKIKVQMATAIKNSHEVWIVTANWTYKKEILEKLFAPDPDNLLGKIKFFNGVDIGQELNIPSNKLQDIHDQGRKGEFLAKKIAQDPMLKNYHVNCVLFDDTPSQIDNCGHHNTNKIKVEGYRVDDYKALRRERHVPAHTLSEEFANRVSKATLAATPISSKGATVSKPSKSQTTNLSPRLIPFQVDFEKQQDGNQIPVSAKEQAIIILEEVERLHQLGAKTVGITYSANQAQTDNIIDTYAKKRWKTGTSGSNQAEVISQIEKLLETSKYKHLQTVYRTIPITTMKYKGSTAMAADDESVMKSLKNADQFIANGGILLGWKNQLTSPGSLAIGGGVAAKVQSTTQKEMIRNWVKERLTSSPVLAQSTVPSATSNVVDLNDVRLMTQDRKSKKGPCFEISCRTEEQAKFIQKELTKQNINIHNMGNINGFWRVKFDNSNQALRIAESIIGKPASDKLETKVKEENIILPQKESSPKAKEQFCLRLGLVESDLQNRFEQEYDQAQKLSVKDKLVPIKVQSNVPLKDNLHKQKAPIVQLIQILDTYKMNRKNFSGSNPEYKTTFFCIGFGFSKTQKFAAVDALKRALNGDGNDLTLHLAALKNGELGKSICKFLDKTELFKGNKIKTVSDLVQYLNNQASHKLTFV